MLESGLILLLGAAALFVFRLLRGPTLFDRVVAANAFGNVAILVVVVYGALIGRTEYVDIGLTYALLNLIGTLAVLKFVRYGDLGREADDEA